MTRPTKPRLIVIAKAPVPGQVKTRLCPPCTPEQAAQIAAAALSDTLAAAVKKLENDANSFETQIRKIVQGYQKVAGDMDHDDLVEEVRGLLDDL